MTQPRPDPQPATERDAVDGAALLDRLRAALTRYVVLPTGEAADAVTLWIAATHAQPAWAHAPRLVIRGPEKRCGKSRLLDTVESTCHQPFITVNSSSAAVYRSITEDPPTMLVDEADTIFGPKADGNEDLRGLLNAGHQRNRPAKRYDAASNRVESIPTFAMAALAGIGAMPDTIEDRAVVIRMRRRGPGETVAPYRHRRDRPPLRQLAEELRAWLRADLPTLEKAEPGMPLEDRAADTWEPLITVADHAGGHWPDRARIAALALTAEADDNGHTSARLRLLADCRTAFGTDTALPTATLLERLKADPDGEWADHGPAGLTAMKLGALLREFDIRSTTARFPGGQAKGYSRADFTDAWNRYCPAPDTPPNQPEPAPGDRRVVLFERGSRTSRTSLNSAGQPGTASHPGTA
ncbi:hypothetical protein Aple_051160 [Acrocarpospora pleiomorpha]|uniref:DUF3631 domain-containing protein n=1 Tax=Acrocarpospora pleiomorpha TaxID=90975 RepID=A0A5M3XQ76_9ACTN|nr:DUF3631 domain-containing protein [Acrocarpospora pleiomorpha]GES22219.1 hypothetical protein Aple_051160 [Acrocarpospora pleiomorpha]